jgi:hypothetical protein
MSQIEVKAEEAPPVDGKPAWFGYHRTSRGWVRAKSDYGPISYTSEAHAEAGARVCGKEF